MQKEKEQSSTFSLLRGLMNLGFIRGVIQQAQLSWMLFRDSRVPRLTKAIPVLTILYLISPVDWLVNLVPILGQLEDVAVLGLGMNLFIRAAPQEVVSEYMIQLAGKR